MSNFTRRSMLAGLLSSTAALVSTDVHAGGAWIRVKSTAVDTAVAPTALKLLGDSRVGYAFTLTQAAAYSHAEVGDPGVNPLVGPIAAVLLPGLGGNYGIPGSTSRSGTKRFPLANNATTGNPAQTDTGAAADAGYSTKSTGVYSAYNDPAQAVFYMYGGNDGGSLTYFTSPLISMQEMSTHLDALGTAGNTVFLSNDYPRGWAYAKEVKAIISLAAQTTNTTQVRVRRLFNKDTGTLYSKVTTLSAAGQYTVSATGALSFFAGDAITSALVEYDYYVTSNATASYDNTLHNWFSSNSPAPFVDPDTGTSYAIAGALYGRGFVKLVDTWAALKDPASGAGPGAYNKKGTLVDGRHPTELGGSLIAQALYTAWTAAFGTGLVRAPLPTANSVRLGTGTSGGQTRFPLTGTFQLPSAGMVPITPGKLVVTAGSVVGVDSDNGDGTFSIAGAGISGSGSYAAGTLFAQFTTAPAPSAIVTVSCDGGVNLIENGLLDAAQGTGTATAVAGLTGVANIPKGWTFAYSGDVVNGLANGTFFIDITTGTHPDTGLPEVRFSYHGTLPGTFGTQAILKLTSNASNAARVTPGQNLRAQVNTRLLPGPDGHLEGTGHANVQASVTAATAVTRPGVNNGTTSSTLLAASSGGVSVGEDEDFLTAMGIAQIKQQFVTPPVDTTSATISSCSIVLSMPVQSGSYVSGQSCLSQSSLQSNLP